MDPCTDLADIPSKVLSLAGGFLGGTSMLFYMKPTDVGDGIRRIVISTLSAIMLTGVTARELFGAESAEVLMGTAFGIGFIAWSLLGAVAKFFEGRQNQDIVQMAKAVNEVVQPKPYYPTYHQPLPRQVDNPDE